MDRPCPRRRPRTARDDPKYSPRTNWEQNVSDIRDQHRRHSLANATREQACFACDGKQTGTWTGNGMTLPYDMHLSSSVPISKPSSGYDWYWILLVVHTLGVRNLEANRKDKIFPVKTFLRNDACFLPWHRKRQNRQRCQPEGFRMW
jgi:hypothetical protein